MSEREKALKPCNLSHDDDYVLKGRELGKKKKKAKISKLKSRGTKGGWWWGPGE